MHDEITMSLVNVIEKIDKIFVRFWVDENSKYLAFDEFFCLGRARGHREN